MGSLDGKVACVTGAARGQGRSHAIALAREGANIIALDACAQIDTVPYPLPTEEDLQETASQVEKLGRSIIFGIADIRDLSSTQRFVDSAVQDLGRLDIVCANAAISTFSPALDMDEETWQTTIDVNLTGAWKTCKATVPHIISGGRGGSVILTSSAATTMISNNIAHYISAKQGLVGLMRALAKELAPNRIRVNTVHPTGVATPMILNDAIYRLFRPDLENPGREDFESVAREHNALGVPFIESEDVSNAVVYLASESGRYITGSTLTLDAGGSLA
ncbi:mycofactocin-coupled SDR family oxidoreductase [Rhodococcus jostii]|uniref:(+)-trans-carveol dehydrogenase n=1 Tax=Rhodococcus jostii TaxID=132919 RepID=A0A1H4IMY9_RHOJO|nr:mycofactocin-coupled SDR family oxidoreductase [Rhodococcus jostii]SEB35235.1 (+)-trans-carveol dehydrogenase [Rhodococcus jostii]